MGGFLRLHFFGCMYSPCHQLILMYLNFSTKQSNPPVPFNINYERTNLPIDHFGIPCSGMCYYSIRPASSGADKFFRIK